MKKYELKVIVSISIGMAAFIAIVYLHILNNPSKLPYIIRAFSFGLSLTTLFWTFYISYGWKLPLLNKVFYRPNLNGTWSGKLISDWRNEQGEQKEPITFYLVVRQSFLRIHFTSFTDNFVGVSYSETFTLKKHQGLKNVSYLYRKDTSQHNNEELQEGAAELRLIEGDVRILQGKYYSSRKTNGSMSVSWISELHVDSYDEATKLEKHGQ